MLSVRTSGQISVVSLRGTTRITSANAGSLKEQLMTFFQKPGTRLVLDLEGITFVDSIGFGVLLSVLKAASNNYGLFKVCNTGSEVMEHFSLLQLHHVFELYDQLDACLASFNQE